MKYSKPSHYLSRFLVINIANNFLYLLIEETFAKNYIANKEKL